MSIALSIIICSSDCSQIQPHLIEYLSPQIPSYATHENLDDCVGANYQKIHPFAKAVRVK